MIGIEEKLTELVDELRRTCREDDWWDFKETHYEDRAALLHDIICLANNRASRDAYLILGIRDKTYEVVQVQNLPQNHLPDLDLAREIVKAGDEEMLDSLFGSVPGTLSELIRTAFIPKEGCRFIVADFSAIEARVLAWLAGEDWVLDEFRGKGKIYEATASRMFHIPQETIVKGHPNYEYRQKGKQATLSCGYGGGVGALKAMGAKMPEEEMQPLVDASAV